jgi:hypothetical protein
VGYGITRNPKPRVVLSHRERERERERESERVRVMERIGALRRVTDFRRDVNSSQVLMCIQSILL